MTRRFATAMVAVFIVVVFVLVGSMSGCSSPRASGDGVDEYVGNRLEETSVQLADGRMITCIVYRGYGLSCDWDVHDDILLP